jgi:tetratricopeptide (TPR) repeat protein
MVVEYVVHRFGMEALKGVLTDLGDDVAINEALARHAEPMDKLEEDFATWFKGQADQLAPKVNWEEPKLLPEDGSGALAAWNKEHADSFWGLIDEGEALLLERKYAEAKVPLNKAAALFPGYAEDDGPYLLLAKAHRELQETKEERDVLMKFAALNADVVVPRLRLLELAEADHDWKTLRSESEKVLGVDPMTPLPYRYLAESAEALGDRATAIAARRTLLLMDPLDKPEQHYRLAKLLYEEGKLAEARREVDLSLEDAPRFRDALGLLLEIAGKMDAASGAAGVDGARRASAMAPTTATSPAGDERLPEEPQP